MKKIYLEQGSAEWHEFRKNHIGGSDAPAIMGVSPYKTRYELWQEKVGVMEAASPNSCMRRGSDLENHVRREINNMLAVKLIPLVFEHPTLSYLSYSSDGYDDESGHLIEIKCGTKAEHEGVRADSVPHKYYPQIQHALLVTDLPLIYYVSHNGGETLYTIVERDEEYIKQLIAEHRYFWRCVEMLEEPKIDEKHHRSIRKELVQKKDVLFEALAKDWKDLQTKKKELEDNELVLRREILRCAGHIECEGFGLKVTKVKKSGYIDYTHVEQLKSVDLEKYRKQACEYWKIECK